MIDPFVRRFLEIKREVFRTSAQDPAYAKLVGMLKCAERDCVAIGVSVTRLSLESLEREGL